MKRLLISLMVALGVTTACCQQDFENTDPEGFAALIADSTVVIQDVRTAEEFKDGHIANALNIDVNQKKFVKKAKATLPKDKTIAVYCRSGRRSANAAALLAKMNVLIFMVASWHGSKMADLLFKRERRYSIIGHDKK